MAATNVTSGSRPLLIKSALGDISLPSSADDIFTEMSVIKVVEEMLQKAEAASNNMPNNVDVGKINGFAQNGDGTSTEPPSVMKQMGVVTYFLLCGKHPYRINDKILKQQPTFAEAPWQSTISGLAKDFVKSLLGPEPPNFEAVKRKLVIWKSNEPLPRLDTSVVTVLRNLAKHSTFQQWALEVMKNILTKEAIQGLYKDQFQMIDLDSDGKVTKAEFTSALQGNKALVAKVDEIHKAMNCQMDNNLKDEVVEFEEFEKYFSHSPFLVKMGPSTKQLIDEAFSKLDEDGDHYITALELHGTVLNGFPDREEMIKVWIDEADEDGDGRISLPEFQKQLLEAMLPSSSKKHGNVTATATRNDQEDTKSDIHVN